MSRNISNAGSVGENGTGLEGTFDERFFGRESDSGLHLCDVFVIFPSAATLE